MTDLKNKNAFITGAGKGIGKAIAIALAKEGVNLILVSRTQADVDQLAAETAALGVKSLALSADVSDISSINSAAEKALAEFKSIDNVTGLSFDHIRYNGTSSIISSH